MHIYCFTLNFPIQHFYIFCFAAIFLLFRLLLYYCTLIQVIVFGFSKVYCIYYIYNVYMHRKSYSSLSTINFHISSHMKRIESDFPLIFLSSAQSTERSQMPVTALQSNLPSFLYLLCKWCHNQIMIPKSILFSYSLYFRLSRLL